MQSVDEYIPIVGEQVVGEIFQRARRLIDAHMVQINSTATGGGVAEILNTLILLLNDAGVDSGWRVLTGSQDFFAVTKQFHNSLQGHPIDLTPEMRQLYLDTNARFSRFTHLDHDLVLIHDPQPLAQIKYHRKRQPWVWRCHIDITSPDPEMWAFVKPIILRYDMVIISSESFRKPDLPLEQRIICPSIDPLSPKNIDLPEGSVAHLLEEAGIPTDKPLVTQVSRFDPWKDPEGVLEVFERVRERADCRLVFCYNMASDDPEGIVIYQRMEELARQHLASGDVLFVLGDNPYLVNALQRASAVVLQKSLREGFGLTVSEAQWKGTPVVAGRVGGIPEQVVDGVTGFLVEPRDLGTCADRVVELLRDPARAREMGRQGRARVRERFLITRHLLDYLQLMQDVLS